MANSNATAPPTTASPPRPRVGGNNQVKRSISGLASPVKLKTGGQRRRNHSHHHQHHPYRYKEHHGNAREVQTAHPVMTRSSLDAPRPDAPAHSRRGSTMAMPPDEGVGRASPHQPMAETREDVLRKELQRSERRVEDLKQSLVELHDFSTATTRRLDETYYAVLEKTSALRATVAALKNLAEASGDIYRSFERDSRGLEDDITSQLSALGPFEEQESKILSLQGRIQSGRAKMVSLAERVDAVRDRVEAWERADHEWQDRTRRRLRVVWSVVAVLSLVVMFLVISVNDSSGPGKTASGTDGVESPRKILKHGALNISRPVPVLGDDGAASTAEPLLWKKPREIEDGLRGFDEL